ncbi:MAG TPA: hypothetical protein VJT31_01590 [Rugosimonospora sp.]|nr:hypothetical protein [Rugosimonospora sp.]
MSEVAAAVLRRNDHRRETLLITGPEALSYPDCAARIGEHIGRLVAYQHLPAEEVFARFVAAGMPDWAARLRVDLHREYDTGTRKGQRHPTAVMPTSPTRTPSPATTPDPMSA